MEDLSPLTAAAQAQISLQELEGQPAALTPTTQAWFPALCRETLQLILDTC